MSDDHLHRPWSESIRVSVHPHVDGDVVSIAWTDAATGQYHVLALEPADAYLLGRSLLTATTDDGVAAQADEMRGK